MSTKTSFYGEYSGIDLDYLSLDEQSSYLQYFIDLTAERTRELIASGAQIDEKDSIDFTPFMYILLCNLNKEVLEEFIQAGADVNDILTIYPSKVPQSFYGKLQFSDDNIDYNETPLTFATRYCESIEMISTLIDHGAKINGKNTRTYRCFFESGSVEELDIEEFIKLLPILEGANALEIAIMHRDIEIINYLLSKGARLKTEYRSPLWFAIRLWNYVPAFPDLVKQEPSSSMMSNGAYFINASCQIARKIIEKKEFEEDVKFIFTLVGNAVDRIKLLISYGAKPDYEDLEYLRRRFKEQYEHPEYENARMKHKTYDWDIRTFLVVFERWWGKGSERDIDIYTEGKKLLEYLELLAVEDDGYKHYLDQEAEAAAEEKAKEESIKAEAMAAKEAKQKNEEAAKLKQAKQERMGCAISAISVLLFIIALIGSNILFESQPKPSKEPTLYDQDPYETYTDTIYPLTGISLLVMGLSEFSFFYFLIPYARKRFLGTFSLAIHCICVMGLVAGWNLGKIGFFLGSLVVGGLSGFYYIFVAPELNRGPVMVHRI